MKCLIGLTAILREAWTTARDTSEKREKIQALCLAKECYFMKLELLTNATVVDDAIRFISSKSKENPKLWYNSNGQYKESNDPNCNEHEKLEEKQEGEPGEMTTANKVF
jgi:hypothetical protein